MLDIIIEDVSGSPIFPWCVCDMDHPLGPSIARFMKKSDAELFVRAKEHEKMMAMSNRYEPIPEAELVEKMREAAKCTVFSLLDEVKPDVIVGEG